MLIARRFWPLALQLALLLVVIREFHLLSPAALRLCTLGFAASLAVPFLPPRQRMPFFCLVSLTAILDVLGLRSGVLLIGLGSALIALASLPMRPKLRLLLLVTVGAALALWRGGAVAARGAWGAALFPVWPILGSMFMFRLGLYVYDRHNNPALARLPGWHAFSYFFLLPNVCFPFFPIIDYVTFSRASAERTVDEAARVVQRGIWMMLLGVSHLLLYRLVRNWMVIDPVEVTNPTLWAGYLISGYLLYLRISGEFHFILGLLHLFGFELPWSHQNYFLADGFPDLARRINIYWRDFMAKVVLYPSLQRLRRRGVPARSAFLLAMPLVAVATVLFHAYQWFWIRGTTAIRTTDVVFWSTAIMLMLFKLRGGTPSRAAARRSPFASVASTAATFGATCVLWSIWNSVSLGEWWTLTSRAFGAWR